MIVYPDDPDAASVDVTGLVPRYEDAVLELYEVPNAVPAEVPSVAARTLVVVAYAATLALLACVACARIAALLRRRR